MVWTLHVYSEDFVLKPEIREHDPAVYEASPYTTAYAKAELWAELKLRYFGLPVLVHYVDGTRKWITVPS